MYEHDPDGYREALRRGHVAVLRGRPREAIDHYQEAGRLAGRRPLPYSAMASVYLQMRQPREAIDAFGAITGMLDANRDGSIADDMARMGGGLLGSLFGKR